MKRKKPLRRRPLRARSLKNSYRRRERDLEFMRDVRKLSCIVRAFAEQWKRLDGRVLGYQLDETVEPTCCEGRVHADHAGVRPFGWKADDTTCIPVCQKHHGERTDYRGTFKDWDAAMMRAFNDWAIDATRLSIAELRHVPRDTFPRGSLQ